MIVRAIGPSLGIKGVSGALADPILELHEPDGTVITNDNWKDTQEAEIVATTVPPSNDLESAIVATLDPGSYTAIVSGKNGGTGMALVEAYDLDNTVDSQLANISTRGFVETGDNVMIGGFIVGGETSRVALRAIGPSLADSGVAAPWLIPSSSYTTATASSSPPTITGRTARINKSSSITVSRRPTTRSPSF